MRPRALILGLATVAIAWFALLLGRSDSFSAHMSVHMSVVAVAAPLLAIGFAGGPWDPVLRKPAIFSPLLASLIEFFVVWIWHTPVLHQAARHSTGVLVAEQSSFLLSGFWLWIAVFGGEIKERAERRGAGVLALLLTVIHMTLLGALLALSPRPLYPHSHVNSELTALEDQQLGGAIMLIVGSISYLTGAIWLVRGILCNRKQSEQPST